MTDTQTRGECIASVAISQVGEFERGYNVTKYHDWYDSHGTYPYRGQPWCAIFVCWCLDQAGARLPTIQAREYGNYPGAASVAILLSWFHQQGWVLPAGTMAQPGDLAIFVGSHHIGIVIKVLSTGRRVLVEGNTQTNEFTTFASTSIWVWPRLREMGSDIAYLVRIPEDYLPAVSSQASP